MTDPRRSSARRIVWAGVVLFWAVQLALFGVFDLPLLDTVLLAVLLAVVPVFSLAQLPLIEGAVIDRPSAYVGSIVSLWFLGSACWFVGTRTGGVEALGLVSIRPGALVTWTTVLTASAFGVMLAFREIGLRSGAHDTALLRQLLPRTGRERGLFALLSVTAGAAEEVAYRGYAIPLLAAPFGTAGAVLLTSATFGVVHAYQGALGVLRTAIMGAILAWGFLMSGSLWPAVIAHALIDLIAGLVLGERLLTRGGGDGMEAAFDPRESEA